MRIPTCVKSTFRLFLTLTFIVGCVLLISAEKPTFTVHDKAFYADPNLVNFVRPGLIVTVTSAQIAADGTIRAWVKFADPKGLPLDREGITTPGSISASLIAAYIPAGKTQYMSYTTRSATGAVSGTVQQASADSGGSWQKIAEGEYIYTFKTKAPANVDRTATHTIGFYGSRDLEEFDLGVDLESTVYNFVPNGTDVTVTRNIMAISTCNRCHQDLSAHGSTGRNTMEVCILCHTPQTVDPDTGLTMNMPVMIHKIHRGADLPSVEAGTPYLIVGHNQSQHDYSHVVFPADVRRCTTCHEQGVGAAQETAYLNPTRVACGACHDDVNFATGENHLNLPQVSDNQCANCHIPEGELEFDASIIGAHTIDRDSKMLPGVVVDLLEVSGMAGGNPTVTFTVKDKAGNPLIASEMDRVRLRLIGPTSDYPREADQEDARGAARSSDGVYTYTFEEAIPADAKGSWAVGVEARNVVTLLEGTNAAIEDVRDLAYNDIVYFSVDGSDVEPRRTVVTTAKCNSCHFKLDGHGGNRNNPDYCVFCHNPNTVGEGETEETEESVDMRVMIHRIHTGAELERDYFIEGNDFSKIEYPGDRRRCDACHVEDSQQLPLNADLLDVKDPGGFLNPIAPTSAACTSCHSSLYAASHALANTTQLGESCAACHGPERTASVDRSHAQ